MPPKPRTPEDVRTDPRVGDTWTSANGAVYTVTGVDAHEVYLEYQGGTCWFSRRDWEYPGSPVAPGPYVPPSTAAKVVLALADFCGARSVRKPDGLGDALCVALDLDPADVTWEDLYLVLRDLGETL